MPVIEIRDGWDEATSAAQSGMQAFVQMSALGMQRERNDLANKIAQQGLDWKTEDRARDAEGRQAMTEFTQAQMGGFSSPADIDSAFAAESKAEWEQAPGAPGTSVEWLGSMNGVAYETPIAMKQAEQRRAQLSDIISRLPPDAQQLAQQHFDKESARDVGLAMQKDVSAHLRATLRRGKLPGHEQVLQDLDAALMKWDASTGEGGMSPAEVEKKFIEIRKEYSDDQNDMKVTESNTQALSAMAQSSGVGENPAVVAAMQGYASGVDTYKTAYANILRAMPGGADVMTELDGLKIQAAREKANNIKLPTGADYYDGSGLRNGGRVGDMTGDQAVDLHSAAQKAYLSEPGLDEIDRMAPDWADPDVAQKVDAWEQRLKRAWGWTGDERETTSETTRSAAKDSPKPEVSVASLSNPETDTSGLSSKDLDSLTDDQLSEILVARMGLPPENGEDEVAAREKAAAKEQRRTVGEQEDADVALRDAGYEGELTKESIGDAVQRAFARGRDDPEKMQAARALAEAANAWAGTRTEK